MPFGAPASASWASCPAEEFRPSHDRPTRPHGPDPDGVSTFRAHETRPGWAPPKPRDQRCPRDRRGSLRSPLAASTSGQALSPGYSSRLPRLSMSRHRRGFTHVRPSGLPLARLLPRTERGPLGFYPELRTPTSRTCRRTSERGPISNTDQELRIRHRRPPIYESTRHARPRVAHTQSNCNHSPGSGIHGRYTRRLPVRQAFFASATARRVVRSEPA